MTPTQQTISRLRELLAKATPLPWEIKNDSSNGQDEVYDYWHRVGPLSLSGIGPDEDELLVAKAINVLPDLLDELERLYTTYEPTRNA